MDSLLMTKFFYALRPILLTTGLLMSSAHADGLLDIYNLAKTNDPAYQAAYASYQADLQNGVIGRAGLLPTVRLSASSGYTGDFGPEFNGLDTRSGTENNYSASVSQSLFDMGDWYSYQNGKLAVERAEIQWLQTERQLILRTVSAYLSVLREIDNLRTVRAEKVAVSSQLEQAQQRFEVGLIAITDVLEAQAAYDDIVSQELDTEGNLAIAFEALRVLTGQSHPAVAPLMDNFPINTPTPSTAPDWLDLAKSGNTALLLSQVSVESAAVNKRNSLTSYYPTITATASYGGNLDGIDNAGRLAGNFDEGGAVRVTLEVPIVTFTGGSTWARRVQASHNLTAAEEQLLSAERSLEQSVRSTHLRVMTSISQVQARLQSIRSSESALEATRAGYEVGTRNLVDVLVAERNLFRARRTYLNTRYDYIQNLLNLKDLAGTLNLQDLQELDRWMDEQNEVLRTQYLP